MANKTVYPYGTGGSLPSSIGIVNDLRTGGADKALAAEQGKVIGDLLTKSVAIDLSDYARTNYFIDTNGVWNNLSGAQCVFIPLDNVMSFRCTADGGACQFAFLKNKNITNGATPNYATGTTKIVLSDGNTGEYDVPGDAAYLYVYVKTTSAEIVSRYTDFTFTRSTLDEISGQMDGMTVKTIVPLFIYSGLSTESGNHGEPNDTYRGIGAYVTPRFIAILGRTIWMTTGKTGRYALYEYDKDFAYLGFNYGDIVSGQRTEINLAYDGTKYIKLRYINNSSFEGDAKTTVTVEGDFPEKWDVFNVRPGDNGYVRVAVSVRVTDPTCCDGETSAIQDASQILTDYGILCLPSKYSNTGKPTRLIIYCHGAAVNYSSSATRFDSQDLDPTYWLAEGYAILDVEGNPFNNTDEHFCIPQAMECYLAAYKWAIEWYNIRRDGVFLGGRSMGGGMTFDLIREQCPIPVIAACPNSPWSTAIGNQSATRKSFWATHCGFDIPAGYTFGNNTLSNNDKTLFYDNFDKLIKNNPVMASVMEVPKTAEEKQAFVNCYASLLPDRKTLWETYRMKAKCPVKLFGCNQDETCPPDYTSGLFYRMLINGAQIAELRLYNSYKDYSGTGTTAHHYDTQDPALRTDITTTFGEELTDVPIVYIEMLAFWRRYEQGL